MWRHSTINFSDGLPKWPLLFEPKGQDKSELIQERIEFISEQLQSETLDFSYLTELLTDYVEHPMNLNAVEEAELQAIFLLSDFQISDFILNRRLFVKFITIY